MDVLNVYVLLTPVTELPYTWNGKAYEIASGVGKDECIYIVNDIMLYLYGSAFPAIAVLDEVTSTLPNQLLAIIDPSINE